MAAALVAKQPALVVRGPHLQVQPVAVKVPARRPQSLHPLRRQHVRLRIAGRFHHSLAACGAAPELVPDYGGLYRRSTNDKQGEWRRLSRKVVDLRGRPWTVSGVVAAEGLAA